jgi:hypothetical protein
MSDPLTLTVLGSLAATEGIKFLYNQASELLMAWRARRQRASPSDTDSGQLRVPIVANDILDGTPVEPVADSAVLDRERRSVVQLIGALSPYAQGQADIDLRDDELAEQAGQLRALLEAAYGQRFTFRGEQREPTGSRVTVKQALGEVEGAAVGVDADVAGGSEVVVDQTADKVKSDGSITGFKGRIDR